MDGKHISVPADVLPVTIIEVMISRSAFSLELLSGYVAVSHNCNCSPRLTCQPLFQPTRASPVPRQPSQDQLSFSMPIDVERRKLRLGQYSSGRVPGSAIMCA